MKSEEIKKEYKKFKIGILSAFAIVILLLLILLDYIFVVRKSYKALAPSVEQMSVPIKEEAKEDGVSPQNNINANSNATDLDFKNDGAKDKAEESNHDAYYYSGLAKQAANNQDWENALKYINKALELNPNVINFYEDKANILLRLSKKQEARDTLNEGLKRFPNSLVLQSALEQITG